MNKQDLGIYLLLNPVGTRQKEKKSEKYKLDQPGCKSKTSKGLKIVAVLLNKS